MTTLNDKRVLLTDADRMQLAEVVRKLRIFAQRSARVADRARLCANLIESGDFNDAEALMAELAERVEEINEV